MERGYVSLWNKDHPQLVASGKVSVKPEVLEAWLNSPVDAYGNINIDIALFHNTRRTSEYSPDITGSLEIKDEQPPQDRQPARRQPPAQQQQRQPARRQPPAQQQRRQQPKPQSRWQTTNDEVGADYEDTF